MNTLKLLVCLAFLSGCATQKLVPLSVNAQIASAVSRTEVEEVRKAMVKMKDHDVNVPIDEIRKIWTDGGEQIWVSCGQSVWMFKRDANGHLQFLALGAKF